MVEFKEAKESLNDYKNMTEKTNEISIRLFNDQQVRAVWGRGREQKKIMPDTMTSEQRHRCMSRIRARDTRPEMIVRRWLWSEGWRYRLCVKGFPGKTDIVFRKLKTVEYGKKK